MTKKRKAPLRVDSIAEDEELGQTEAAAQRLAPNTNFLGRLVRGVATGNQRQIDTTNSNAANLSIGATGAASLRLQLQRAASSKAPRYQALRRVVLSSAAQQRLTLCSALLAEVAQGFGFHLTVRQPDGKEVGAREAIDAVAKGQQSGHPDAAADGGEPPTPDAPTGDDTTEGNPKAHLLDEPADNGEAVIGEGGTQTDGKTGAAPRDPLDDLEPLVVDLALNMDSQGGLLQALQAGKQTQASSRIAARLARSPSGTRRPAGLNALLSGRLTSATLGSLGLVAKKTAAAQALQSARRRALARAASNASAEETGAVVTAAVADASAAAGDGDSPACDEADARPVGPASASADPATEVAGTSTVATGAAAANTTAVTNTVTTTSRQIVWDPDKLPRLSPPPATLGPLASGVVHSRQTPSEAPEATATAPAAKRIRATAAHATASPELQAANNSEEGGTKEPMPGSEDEGPGTDSDRGEAEGDDVEQAGPKGDDVEQAGPKGDDVEQAGPKDGVPKESGDRAAPEANDSDAAPALGVYEADKPSSGDGGMDAAADGGATVAEAGPTRKRGRGGLDAERTPERDPSARTAPGARAGAGAGRPRAPFHTGLAAAAARAAAGDAAVGEGQTAAEGHGGTPPRAAAGAKAAAAGRPPGSALLGAPASKLFGAAVRQLQRHSHG